MNRSILLGFLGLATAASISVHLYKTNGPRYVPRHLGGDAQGWQGALEWLSMVRANEVTGRVEPGDRERMGKAVAAYNRANRKSASWTWTEMGPDNVGGRVRAICVDPNNTQKLWAGSVSGGLFRSWDGANMWERIPSFSTNLIISSIAILGNGHLYVATGSEWEGGGGNGGSGFVGDGVFMSSDDGATFTQVLNADPSWDGSADWAVITRIKADPANPNRVYIASNEPGARIYDESSGLVLEVLPGTANTQSAYDVEVSGDGGTILWSIGSGDAYLSTNGGGSYDKLDGTPGVGFPQSQIGRLELAISPDNANYMYAIAATGNGRMSGIWNSTDQGQNWFRIWPSNISDTDVNAVPELDIFKVSPMLDAYQGHYDNAIAVRRGHPDEVWVGGVTLWKTTLSGQPNQLAVNNVEPGCFFCVHSDIHEIVFADANTAYIGCDGGIHKTPNAGFNFYAANRNLSITQFYSMAYNPQGHVIGGTQDNGTMLIDGYGNTPEESVDIDGGDGFDTEMSQMDTNILFTSVYYGSINRSNDQGTNVGPFYDQNVPVDPNSMLGAGLGDFYTNFSLFEDPNDQNSPWIVKKVFSIGANDMVLPGETRGVSYRGHINSVEQWGYYTNPSATDTIFGPFTSDTLEFQDKITCLFAAGFTGGQGIWVTREAESFNVTPTWAKITTAQGAGGNVNCMAWSNDGNTLFWGTSEGEIYRISGFNNAYTRAQLWGDSTATCVLGPRETVYSGANVVTGLAPDAHNVNGLVATFGNYGGNSKVRRTVEALQTGPTWTNIWNVPGELEGMPCYDAVIHKDNENIIAVATEFGVWVTDDGGGSWTNQTNGLQGVPTFAIRQQTWNWENNPVGPDWITNPNVIYAGTHGRGIFRTEDLLSIPPIGNGAFSLDEITLMPNPASTQSVVRFTLRKSGDVAVNVYDMDGRLVRNVSRKNLAATVQNIPLEVADLGTGTYIVEVMSAGQRRTGRMVVVR